MKNRGERLDWFQKQASKFYDSLGFNSDNMNTMFGFMVEMKNTVAAAEKSDTILFHKHMGLAAEWIANYCTVHGLKLSKAVDLDFFDMEDEVADLDLEYFFEQIQKELQFKGNMSDDEKIKYVRKMWLSLMNPEYHNDFLKTDRILVTTIKDNEIKYPEKLLPTTSSAEERYGQE